MTDRETAMAEELARLKEETRARVRAGYEPLVRAASKPMTKKQGREYAETTSGVLENLSRKQRRHLGIRGRDDA